MDDAEDPMDVNAEDPMDVNAEGPMDVNAEGPMDVDAATNTYELPDNCYYVTAAHLAGMDTAGLISQTGQMQSRGGAQLPEVAQLFNAAGLDGGYQEFASFGDVQSAVETDASGLSSERGLAYTRADGSGHMVVAAYDPNAQFQYLDYQGNALGDDVTSDVGQGTGFYLFNPSPMDQLTNQMANLSLDREPMDADSGPQPSAPADQQGQPPDGYYEQASQQGQPPDGYYEQAGQQGQPPQHW